MGIRCRLDRHEWSTSVSEVDLSLVEQRSSGTNDQSELVRLKCSRSGMLRG